MNRSVALFVTVACSLLVAGTARAAHAAEARVDIRKVEVTEFPEVAVTVSIESRSPATAADVRLTENGKEVDASVESLGASGEDVEVVLAIDTSGSMEGQPLSAALAAALRFVTTVPDEIGVGILTFSDKPRVLQPITASRADALESLGALQAKGETSLYDAVAAAARMFSKPAQRNIILLSDGGDTASNGTLKSAAAAARRAGAAVFSVGLDSAETDIRALRTLSGVTEGRYAPAAAARLTEVYKDLATELGNQYLVSYDSRSRGGGELSLAVSAFGSTDGALFLAPALEVPLKPAAPARPEPTGPQLSGTLGLYVAVGLCFGAVFLIAFMLLGAGARTRRDRELARRMAASPDAPLTPEAAERGLAGWIPDSFVGVADRVADAGGFATELDAKLERAGLPLRAGEFLAVCSVAAMAGVLVGTLLFQRIVFTLVVAGLAAFVPRIVLGVAVRRREDRLHGQLADVMMILASSLRAGHSFFQALDMVAKEIGEPASVEFGRVVAEIRLGRPVDEAMNALSERIGSDDFKWAVLAVNIQREVGGNLAEVLDTVAETVRERDTIRRQIDVLTAEGRLSVAILTALPIGVALYIAKVNPEYMNLLVGSRVGLVMVAVATSLLTLGIFWMRKVVKIDV